MSATTTCPLCDRPAAGGELAEASWMAPETLKQLRASYPGWQRPDGACPACVQEALLRTLLDRGDEALHESVQSVWPLDAEAAFRVLPTPLRLHADPRFSGRGVTIALIDTGFYPHPDLTRPTNRIRAWVDATRSPPRARYFGPQEAPTWPSWNRLQDRQWHGTMTSVTAAGNGHLSHGLYRGLASNAMVVLIQVKGNESEVTGHRVLRALQWLLEFGRELDLGVVNLSLGTRPCAFRVGDSINEAVAELVARGVTVVAAAGNDGVQHLDPPASAPAAITVGGIDDHNALNHDDVELWHGNYGESPGQVLKPELVAPSIWVAAPILPGSALAREAAWLFAHRHDTAKAEAGEARIAETKLITPHYQHVDGTSFAAPLTASAVATMLEANPELTPDLVRLVLVETAEFIPRAPVERQGAGALSAGRAAALALHLRYHDLEAFRSFPPTTGDRIEFVLHDHHARTVEAYGSWDDWRKPVPLTPSEPGLWRGQLPLPDEGRYGYKFLLDGIDWLADPANPRKTHDGFGGFNSLLQVRKNPPPGNRRPGSSRVDRPSSRHHALKLGGSKEL